MTPMSDFNLQTFLSEMRAEQRESLAELRAEQREGFETITARAAHISDDLTDHELVDVRVAGEIATRLAALETLHGNVRWGIRSVIGAAIVAASTYIYHILVP